MKLSTVLVWGLVVGAPGAGAAELTLYADDGYQGRALSVVVDERQLDVRNFNDRASSVVIESSAWILCSGEDFEGRCVTLEPGRYTSLSALGLDDAVTSVRRAERAPIGVFTDAGVIAQAGTGSAEARVQDARATSVEDVGSVEDATRTTPRPPNSLAAAPAVSQLEIRIMSEPRRETLVLVGDDCAVRYDARGMRVRNEPGCTDRMVDRADDAMQKLRREKYPGE